MPQGVFENDTSFNKRKLPSSNPKIRSSNVKIIEVDLISYVNDRLYNLTTSFARSLELAITKVKLSIF